MNNIHGYVITIDKDHDLYKHTIFQLDELIKYKKFTYETIDGVILTDYVLFNNSKKNEWETLASAGNTHAHYKCIKKSLENNCHALIIEDDVYFHPKFYRIFEKILDSLFVLEDWDIFHFYETEIYRPRIRPLLNLSSTGSTHFYLINNKKKEKILSVIEKGNLQIDHAYVKYSKSNDILMYSIKNNLVRQVYDIRSTCNKNGKRFMDIYLRKCIFTHNWHPKYIKKNRKMLINKFKGKE